MKFANTVESEYIRGLVLKHGNAPSALVALRNTKPKLYQKFTHFAGKLNSENLYLFTQQDKKPLCPVCRVTSTKFISFPQGYKEFCSPTCVGNSDKVRAKKSLTCQANHGTDYPQQAKEVREKTVKSVIKKFGVSNVSKVGSVKRKRTKTMLSRYGVKNANDLPDIKERIAKTSRSKYGCEHFTQNKQVKEKAVCTSLENFGETHHLKNPDQILKRKERMLLKYGCDEAVNVPEYRAKAIKGLKKTWLERGEQIKAQCRATSLERYGVEFWAQDREKFNAALFKRNNYKIKGKLFKLQGYEHFAIKHLVSLGCKVKNISTDNVPTIRYTHIKRNRVYHPDFSALVRGVFWLYEVKSTYTIGCHSKEVYLKVKAKAVSTVEAGHNYALIVVAPDGKVIKTFYNNKGLTFKRVQRLLG